MLVFAESAFEYIISAAVWPDIALCYLLIEHSLRSPYITDALQYKFKMIITPFISFLETFIVHNKALTDKFTKNLRCPYTKLSSFCRIHTIAHSNYCIQIIKFCVVLFSIACSYSNFSNN